MSMSYSDHVCTEFGPKDPNKWEEELREHLKEKLDELQDRYNEKCWELEVERKKHKVSVANNVVAVEALKFYGNKHNWEPNQVLRVSDCEPVTENPWKFGGHHAREALRKMGVK